nr:CLJU_RS11820 family redox protein [uncultured Desulfobulbus sp.]
MSQFSFVEDIDWLCAECQQPLQPTKVQVNYLKSAFHVELMACPKCGFTFVPESLATGKMLEVEQLLEDK